ncbi:hypothetical protein SAMN05444377_1247 [Flavobacterium fontis]|uniref:DUF6705 domain-containing protein n=1 Tax=Flavobacterium fontis TaxID=1124188 RepID=A0A1M5EZG2_9FLAO|nr:hypothetical protein [Flavobacterium fontis]SHF84556.1 hypothetical protein SAMN05444377_1247 [Flavobacterium fontis]
MKKKIFSILLIMISFIMQGQTVKPIEQYFDLIDQDNVYFKDVNNLFDKFLGEWEATNGLHYVKIKITKSIKVEQGLTNNYRRLMTKKRFFDIIHIDYTYIYNGTTIYNVTMPYPVLNGKILSSEIFGYIIINNNLTLDLFYNEVTNECNRDKTGNLKLTYINSVTPQLNWERTEKQILMPDSFCTGNQIDTSPYKIPANLTFIKL